MSFLIMISINCSMSLFCVHSGSCWAFSTTGSLEGRASIKTGVTDDAVVTLSEQQLVDCSGSYGNKGCQGGLMDDAFKYIKDNGGLCSEKEYPYTGKDGAKCAASTCGTKYDAISGYKDVNGSSFSSLEAAVAEGPVSIAIQANTLAFQFYHSGVFTGNWYVIMSFPIILALWFCFFFVSVYTVELNSTTVCWSWDMGCTMDKSTGRSRIRGVLLGEWMDTFSSAKSVGRMVMMENVDY